MITCHDPTIPKEKFLQFHQLLCQFGGRYVSNPRETFGDSVVVHYQFEDVEQSNNFNTAWRNATEDVLEFRKDQWWRKLLRRIGMNL